MLPFDQYLDARGLACPLPLLKAKKLLNTMRSGEVLYVVSSDPTSLLDFRAFADQTGHALLDSRENFNEYFVWIKKL